MEEEKRSQRCSMESGQCGSLHSRISPFCKANSSFPPKAVRIENMGGWAAGGQGAGLAAAKTDRRKLELGTRRKLPGSRC